VNIATKDSYPHHGPPGNPLSPPIYFPETQKQFHTQQQPQHSPASQPYHSAVASPSMMNSPNAMSHNLNTPGPLLQRNDYFDQNPHPNQHQRHHSQDMFEQPKTPLRLLSKSNTMPITSPNSTRNQESKSRSCSDSRPSPRPQSRSRPHTPLAYHRAQHHRTNSRPHSTRVNVVSVPPSPQKNGDDSSVLSSESGCMLDEDYSSMTGSAISRNSAISRTSGVPLVHPSFENQATVTDFLQQHDRSSVVLSHKSSTPTAICTASPLPATSAPYQSKTPETVVKQSTETDQFRDDDEKEIRRAEYERSPMPMKKEFVVPPEPSTSVSRPFPEEDTNVFSFAVPDTPLVSSFNSSETSTVCLKAPAPVR